MKKSKNFCATSYTLSLCESNKKRNKNERRTIPDEEVSYRLLVQLFGAG